MLGVVSMTILAKALTAKVVILASLAVEELGLGQFYQ